VPETTAKPGYCVGRIALERRHGQRMPSYKLGSGVEPRWYALPQRGEFEVTEDIVLNDPSAGSRGVAVAFVSDQQSHASEHERITQAEFARRLAALKDYEAGGLYDPRRHYPGHVYFVPGITLTGSQATALGIRGPDDLFGGVVPHAFVATKVISHPLAGADAAALPGWNPAFGGRVGDAVLAGYAAFNHDDAHRAGRRLLENGPVRIKLVRATGGHGQSVARDAAELQRQLEAIDPDEVVSHGLVLEENLSEVRTFSVGQVKVGDLTASYFGQQRLTRNNRGAEVYGGSDLTVVRGDFGALLAEDVSPEIRSAIGQAQRYNAAVMACYPGFFASRNNYDIVLGRDAAGRSRSGVLEQSWRLGGATGAEIAALEVFRNQPGRNLVRACAIEIFGDSPAPPMHATVYFRGNDPRAGRLTKYTVVEPDAYP
jgi:Protein of unknown function (DUF3182)